MSNIKEKKLDTFGRLLEIMDDLREKCPWDKKQTIQSLRTLTIEEAYELSQAILDDDMGELKKELGDLLLHIVFYAKIASELGAFNIEDVCESIVEKLIHRHPHIYGDVKVKNAREVKDNWEKLKLKEGRSGVLEGVPKFLPAMIKAYRIQEKASGVGFDWDTRDEVRKKVDEELDELSAEVCKGKSKRIEEEFGDVVFSLINYARFIGINPENALEKANEKFIERFAYVEKKGKQKGKALSEMSLSEMNGLWEAAKDSI